MIHSWNIQNKVLKTNSCCLKDDNHTKYHKFPLYWCQQKMKVRSLCESRCAFLGHHEPRVVCCRRRRRYHQTPDRRNEKRSMILSRSCARIITATSFVDNDAGYIQWNRNENENIKVFSFHRTKNARKNLLLTFPGWESNWEFLPTGTPNWEFVR